MTTINHANLTDPYLHEPRGVATAAVNKVYVANGSGSGAWQDHRGLALKLTFPDRTTTLRTSIPA